jgi:hypothetical protein
MTPLHLGADHPLETALVLLLAFGPFIILGIVVVAMRRRDAEESDQEQPIE